MLIEKTAESDLAALKEIGDRLDGRAAQSHEHCGKLTNTVINGRMKGVKVKKK